MAILGISRVLDSLTRRTFGTLDLPVSPMPPSSRSPRSVAEPPGSLVVCLMRMVLDIPRTVLDIWRIWGSPTRRSPQIDL
jgi:hypothetical protein